MSVPTIDEIFAENLSALMGEGDTRRPQSFLAKKGVSQNTVGQVLRKERSVTLRTLAVVAKEFDMEPWQLLVNGMDPKQRPLLQKPEGNEEAFYAAIRKLATDMGIGEGE